MREQMKALDDLEMGDLWAQALHRTPQPDPGPEPHRSPVRSRIVAAVVAIAVFLVAGAFALKAFDERKSTVGGSRPVPPANCPEALPAGAIPVVGCEQAVEHAWSMAAFASTADSAKASWRKYPGSFEGQTIPSWLITFGNAEFVEGNDGCSASGSVASYTVVVSASSGALVASDGPPEGCSVVQQTVPLVELPSDPCTLVTSDQVAAATSSKVLSSRRLTDSEMKVPGAPLPCDFVTDGRFGRVLVVSVPNDPQGFTDLLNKDPANREIVSGVGDGAFISGGAAIDVALGHGHFQIVMQLGAGAEAEPPLRRLADDALRNLARTDPPSATGVSATSVTVTKAGSLDVSSLGGLVAAQEAYGSLWVGVVTDIGGTEIDRIDPDTGATKHTFPIQGWSPNEWGGNGIVVGGGKVWIPGHENGRATLVRIDPATDTADVSALDADGISYLTFGSDGMLWANIGRSSNTAIAHIDPTTSEIIQTWPYTADWAHEICEEHGVVWVHEMSTSNSTVHGGWLSQVVPGTAPQVETGGTFAGPACAPDAVWTAINGDEK